jgi:hypothetical protein
MISGSAVKFHLTNVAMNSLPNLGEMMNKNPDYADKLRQHAASDKIKQQSSKTRDTFNNAAEKEHLNANQKTSDIQMLKEKQEEYDKMQRQMAQQQMAQQHTAQQQMMEQQQRQLLDRQRQMDELEMRLQTHMSDTRSAYSPQEHSQSIHKPIVQTGQKMMTPPIIPDSLRGMVGSSPQYINNSQQEFIRQKQIENQKNYMINSEKQRGNNNNFDTISHEGKPMVNLNPDLDNIINFNNSKIDDLSTFSGSEMASNDSKVKIAKRKRTLKRNKVSVST